MWYIIDGKDLKPEDQLVNVKELNQKIAETKEDVDKNYVKKEEGKGLSTNDYTYNEKTKLSGIEDDAEVNVQVDWNQEDSTKDDFIKNKPTIPPEVTESTISEWGFTKNTGTYSKPSDGIPSTDLSSDVQTSLGKADTAIQDVSDKQDLIDNNNKLPYSLLSGTPTIPSKTSQLTNDSDFITNTVNNLINYTLKTDTGSLIDLEINSSTYVVSLSLKDQDGNVISTDSIDLPLETVVVGGRYDSTTKEVILTLENGNEVKFSVADLVAGLQTELSSSNKLNADYIDDSNSGKKLVTTSEKNNWNNKLEQSDLTDYVKNTDYATTEKAGVIKYAYGLSVNQNGQVYGSIFNYEQYNVIDRGYFISKGTLENVITGKGLVSNTDYASSNTGGVIKTSNGAGIYATSSGTLYAVEKTYSDYASFSNNGFISKGTLENVITGKELVNKTYVDDLVGDIESILETIDVGSGV